MRLDTATAMNVQIPNLGEGPTDVKSLLGSFLTAESDETSFFHLASNIHRLAFENNILLQKTMPYFESNTRPSNFCINAALQDLSQCRPLQFWRSQCWSTLFDGIVSILCHLYIYRHSLIWTIRDTKTSVTDLDCCYISINFTKKQAGSCLPKRHLNRPAI